MAYTKKEIEQILNTYKLAGYNAAETARLLKTQMEHPPEPPTIRKYAKANGYPISPRGGKRIALDEDNRNLSEENKGLIIQKLFIYGSVCQTAKSLGHTRSTISKVLKERGLRWDLKTKNLESLL